MPKILVSCVIADGHVNPFLKVIKYLVEKGHKIVWICGRSYKKAIEATGANFYPAPLDYDPNGIDIYDFKPELKRLKGIAQIKFYIKTWCYNAAMPYLNVIKEIEKTFRPDLYLSVPMVYSLYFQAELMNRPSINLHVVPITLASIDHAPFESGLLPSSRFFGRLRNRALNFFAFNIVFKDLKKQIDAIRENLILQPYWHIFNGFLKSADKVLIPSVPSFDYPRSDQPNNIKYIGPILPNRRDDFVKPSWHYWEKKKK